jgi:hypothetical protein
MTGTESRSRLLIAGTLSIANIALVGSLALAGLAAPAHAQGQNREAIVKTSKAAPCPSGWRHPDGSTSVCEPMGTIAPKVYAKKEKETCADGYYEVYRVWCSTKKP